MSLGSLSTEKSFQEFIASAGLPSNLQDRQNFEAFLMRLMSLLEKGLDDKVEIKLSGITWSDLS